MGSMQAPSSVSMSPMQDPDSMGLMQDAGSMGTMQGPGSMGLKHVPSSSWALFWLQGLGRLGSQIGAIGVHSGPIDLSIFLGLFWDSFSFWPSWPYRAPLYVGAIVCGLIWFLRKAQKTTSDESMNAVPSVGGQMKDCL